MMQCVFGDPVANSSFSWDLLLSSFLLFPFNGICAMSLVVLYYLQVENELPGKIERLVRCEASAYQKLLMTRVDENLGAIGAVKVHFLFLLACCYASFLKDSLSR
jgi:hypothetical protein